MTSEDITRVKGLGFLRNRGTERFSGRVVSAGGVYTAEQLTAISECARRFGSGKVALTTRQTVEIVGIPFEKIDEAAALIEAAGLVFGGTGARVRPITSCKGTTCVYGCYDTQALAARLHKLFYGTEAGANLPHKFKIGVGGCPNSCIKPSLNDLGIEGHYGPNHTAQLAVYVGGTWGKTTRTGTRLGRFYTEEEIPGLIARAIEWYRANGQPKERFGVTIDRVGMEAFEAYIHA